MAIYFSTKFATPEEFEAWLEAQEHGNKSFLDNLCEQDKQRWDTKACKMIVKDGKLQLLCENGNVLAEANYYQPDEQTVCCGGENGELCVKGIQNANEPDGRNFKMWVGTNAEYQAIRVKDAKCFYWITDDATFDDVVAAINALNETFTELETALMDGSFKVKKAENADKADQVSAGEAETNKERHVWFSTGSEETKRAKTDKFTYNPVTNTLKVGNVDGKATTAGEADNATNTDNVICVSIRELSDLNKLITNKQSCAIVIPSTNTVDITVGGITLPKSSRGWLNCGTTATLMVVDTNGIIYSAFYANGTWTARKSNHANTADKATTADTATMLNNDGVTFGRKGLLEYTANFAKSFEKAEKSLTLSENLLGKYLVIKIVGAYSTELMTNIYTEENVVFKLPPFAILENDTSIDIPFNGRTFTFKVNEKKLTYKIDDVGPTSSNGVNYRYCIAAIYEEF